VRQVALALALATAACSDQPPAGDRFPIYVDRPGGALTTQVAIDGAAPVTAVIDVLSPLTVVDVAADAAPRRAGIDLTILGRRAPGDDARVTRARFRPTALFQHPCAAAEVCTVGDPAAPVPIGAVIGGDTLRDDALRVRAGDDTIYILDDIAGEGAARDRACDAVIDSAFHGGGTLVVGGTEVAFAGLRPAVGLCLSPDPCAASASARGVDATLLVSSGLGPSILAASRYEAWRQVSGAPALADLPEVTVRLPSGAVTGRAGQIDRFAIAGRAVPPDGACREIYRHYYLTGAAACLATGDDPCVDDDSCSAPAVVELATAIAVVVIADDAPLLQSLRAELRPGLPEVDGILGLDALTAVELDVDYPNTRLLVRCAGAGCALRPPYRDGTSAEVIAQCLARATPAVDAGVDAP
jgi:hypothetical protein